MDLFYTQEYIDEYAPEHCRTSCSDEHPINSSIDGHGCLRCNALLFQKEETQADKIKQLESEIARLKDQYALFAGKGYAYHKELASCQSENMKLREVLNNCRNKIIYMLNNGEWYRPEATVEQADNILSTSSNNTALNEYVATTLENLADEEPINGNHMAQMRVLLAASMLRNKSE